MGRARMWGSVLLAAALFLFHAQSIAGAEKVYINGIDANFPPFSVIDQWGNPDGFDVRALDWIAQEMGFKVKHQPVDWDGIIPSLRSKKIDIIASGLSITEDRKKLVNFTVAYWTIRHVLLAKRDAKITADRALAAGHKIGVQRGTAEARWIEENLIKKAGKRFELVHYDSVALAVEEIIDDRVTAVAMEDAPALAAAAKHPVKIIGGFGMGDREYGYAVRKEDGALLRKLNEGLKRLMKSEHWDVLKRAYIDK